MFVRPVKKHKHHRDVRDLQRVMLEGNNPVSYRDTYEAWEEYSKSKGKDWVDLTDPDSDCMNLIRYLVEVEDDIFFIDDLDENNDVI